MLPSSKLAFPCLYNREGFSWGTQQSSEKLYVLLWSLMFLNHLAHVYHLLLLLLLEGICAIRFCISRKVHLSQEVTHISQPVAARYRCEACLGMSYVWSVIIVISTAVWWLFFFPQIIKTVSAWFWKLLCHSEY